MRRTYTVQTIIVIFALFSVLGASADVYYSFDNLNEVRVAEGEADLSHSMEGHNASGCIVIGGLRSRDVLVKLGDPFPVQPGASYLLHA